MGRDHFRGGLVVGPFANPAFVQLGGMGKLRGGERLLGCSEGLVETKLVAQVDHSRSDGTFKFAEEHEREHLQFVWVNIAHVCRR